MGDATNIVKGTVVSRLLGGSAAGSLGFLLSVVQAVLQVPLLLEVWPAETFILWVGVQGLFGLITSVDVGFHAFVGAEANMIGAGKTREVQLLLSSAARFATVSGMLQLLACLIAAGTGWYWSGSGQVSSYLNDIGLPLVVLATYWLVAGTQNGLVARVYLAYGETVRYQLFGAAQKALLFVATISTAWCGGGLLAVTTAYAAAASVAAVCVTFDLRRRHSAILPRWGGGCWAVGRKTFRRSVGISLSMFLDQTTNGGVAAYVSAAIPAGTASQFSTIRSLTNAISQAAGVVMFPTVPELGRDATPARIGRAALLIDVLMLVCVTPLAVAMTVAAPWIPRLYSAWTRQVLVFDAVVFICLAAAVLVRQVGMPYQLFLIATNEVSSQFKATSIRAAVLATGVLAFAAVGGAAGVAAALVLAETAVLGFAYVATALRFQAYEGQLGRLQAGLAMTQVCTSLAVTAAIYHLGEHAYVASVVGMIAHAAVAFLQARAVPAMLRDRVVLWFCGHFHAVDA